MAIIPSGQCATYREDTVIESWVLVVYIVYGTVNQVWATVTFPTETECREWQAFYSEYPFRPECQPLKKGV